MLHRLLLPLASSLLLAGCVSSGKSGEPGCPPAPPGSAYMDILEVQQGLNQATRDLQGEWAAAIPPLFERLEAAIANHQQLAAGQPEGCRGDYGDQIQRLRHVRGRGLEVVGRIRQYRRAQPAGIARGSAPPVFVAEPGGRR